MSESVSYTVGEYNSVPPLYPKKQRSNSVTPRKYRKWIDILEKIWPKVGSSEFIYAYIQQEIGGSGILKQMRHSGIIVPVRYLSNKGGARVWKLTPEIASAMTKRCGKPSLATLAKCQDFVSNYRVLINDRCSESYKNSYNKRRCRYNETISLEYIRILQEIYGIVGSEEFTFKTLKLVYPDKITHNILRSMRIRGFLEQLNPGKSPVFYRVVIEKLEKTP